VRRVKPKGDNIADARRIDRTPPKPNPIINRSTQLMVVSIWTGGQIACYGLEKPP